jgi:RecB family endonuclease NucS
LQRLLKDNIAVVAPGVLVISEEFGEWDDSKRRIDLPGIDQDAKLVVSELKRDEDGGHMELQAIRYAAMVSRMTFQRAVKTYQHFLDKMDLRARPRSGCAQESLSKTNVSAY